MCTEAFPCTRLAAELPQVPITSPSDPLACDDPRWSMQRTWISDETPRYACLYRPASSHSELRPLIVWFHPGGEGGDVAETETHLLDKAIASQLILALPQGRNLHFPTNAPRDGRHHDFYFRDLRAPSDNPDIASADRLIDDIVAEGGVDPSRIYVMGWSNGAFFGQLYAIARHATPTPGGSRVAAAAVFAGADPFDDIERDPFTGVLWEGEPRCKLTTTPASTVPILVVYRTCDLAVPCGSSDLACFGAEPGFVTSTWVTSASARGLPGLVGQLIGGVERGAGLDVDQSRCTEVPVCSTAPCTVSPTSAACLCLVNHLRWPDGDYPNGSGEDREPAMLEFLLLHPLQ